MPTENFKNLTEKEFAKKLEEYNKLSDKNRLTFQDRKNFVNALTPRQRKIYSDDLQKRWDAEIDAIITIMKKYSKE